MRMAIFQSICNPKSQICNKHPTNGAAAIPKAKIILKPVKTLLHAI